MTKNIMWVLLLPFLLAACQQNKYYWGDYSSSLYDYYKDPNAENDYVEALAKVTDGQSGAVPPGLYAEYGYEELAHGNTSHAIELFEKEKAVWPESAIFMDKAIAGARAGSAKPASMSSIAILGRHWI